MKTYSQFLLLLLFLRNIKASNDHVDFYGCPIYHHLVMKRFENFCYQFVPYEKYWNEANSFCQEGGGRLVKVDNSKINEFIIRSLNEMSYWTNNGVWIGLNDLNHEGTWMWSNKKDKAAEPLNKSFSYWGPSTLGSVLWHVTDCVRMSRGWGDWRWYETACSTYNWKYRFICQYDAIEKYPDQAQNLQAENIEETKISPKVESQSDSYKSLLITLIIFMILLLICLLVIFKLRKDKRKQRMLIDKLYNEKKSTKQWPYKLTSLFEIFSKERVKENIDNIKNEKCIELFDEGKRERCSNIYTPSQVQSADKGDVDKSENIYEEIEFKKGF